MKSPEFIHAGGASGFTAALVLHPDLRLGIFVAFNSQAPPWGIVRGILDRFDENSQKRPPPARTNKSFQTDEFAGYYRNAEFPVTGLPRIGILFGQQRIVSAGPGQIQWNGKTYEAVERQAFRQQNGEAVVAFGGPNSHIENFFRQGGEYQRVPWYIAYPTQLTVWIVAVLLQLIALPALVQSGLRWLRARNRAQDLESQDRGNIRNHWNLRIVGIAVVVNFVFMIWIGVLLAGAIGGSGIIEYGLPIWLKIVLLIPWVTGVIGLVIAVRVAFAWQRHQSDRFMHASVLAGAAGLLLFTCLAVYWNLVLLPGI